jgi:hypothetical protein
MSYDFLNAKDETEFEPDRAMHFYTFMLAFWPVSIILGLIDFYLIHDYDLRIPTLLAGLGAGWLAMTIYRRNELKRFEAGEHEDDGRVPDEHHGRQRI